MILLLKKTGWWLNRFWPSPSTKAWSLNTCQQNNKQLATIKAHFMTLICSMNQIGMSFQEEICQLICKQTAWNETSLCWLLYKYQFYQFWSCQRVRFCPKIYIEIYTYLVNFIFLTFSFLCPGHLRQIWAYFSINMKSTYISVFRRICKYEYNGIFCIFQSMLKYDPTCFVKFAY